MKLIKNNRRFVVFMGLLIVIATLLTLFSYTLASTLRNDSENAPPTYPVNDDGLTYGSAAFANSIETEPDLVSVVGENGVRGYVYSTDLNEPMPRNPEEAAEIMRRGQEPRTIIVYKEDGKTAIGEFITGGGMGMEAEGEYPK